MAIANAVGVSAGANNHEVGSTLMFECIGGYEASANMEVECLPTLEWSQQPTCESKFVSVVKLNC